MVFELEKIVCGMGGLQVLDILVPPVFSNEDAVIQQCFTLSNNLKELSLRYELATLRLCDTMRQWLEVWANLNYTPRKLNIVVDRKLLTMRTLNTSLQSYVLILRNKTLQRSSDLEDIGTLLG